MFYRLKNNLLYKTAVWAMVLAFGTSLVCQPTYAQSVLNLPTPGTMVLLSPSFTPAMIKGMTIYPDDPFKFDFIIDKGDTALEGEDFKAESAKLIKYFLASLTTSEEKMWVNLSPYEKDRIIADGFDTTEMGRDLLAQDYILKQLTASLLYPENELGKAFWNKVYAEAKEKLGTTDIPMDTFNKVWIIPERAEVYVHGKSAFVVDSHLKVMLEEEYKSGQWSVISDQKKQQPLSTEHLALTTLKEIIIPEIEKEVNEGKNFAQLRQIYHSLILATWYKKNLKKSLFGQVYVDKNKTKGVDVEDKQIKQKIYDQYLAAFKKGAYDYIKEDYNPETQEVVSKKYFSGGVDYAQLGEIHEQTSELSQKDFASLSESQPAVVTTRVVTVQGDAAMGVKNSQPKDLATRLSELAFRTISPSSSSRKSNRVVQPGLVISEEAAEFIRKSLSPFESGVDEMEKDYQELKQWSETVKTYAVYAYSLLRDINQKGPHTLNQYEDERFVDTRLAINSLINMLSQYKNLSLKDREQPFLQNKEGDVITLQDFVSYMTEAISSPFIYPDTAFEVGEKAQSMPFRVIDANEIKFKEFGENERVRYKDALFESMLDRVKAEGLIFIYVKLLENSFERNWSAWHMTPPELIKTEGFFDIKEYQMESFFDQPDQDRISGVRAVQRTEVHSDFISKLLFSLKDQTTDAATHPASIDRAVLADISINNHSAVHQIDLGFGRRVLSTLSEKELQEIIPGRREYSLFESAEAREVAAQLGRTRITRLKNRYNWGTNETSLEMVNLQLDILDKIKQLDAGRTDKSVPIVVLDWGAGTGRALKELSEELKKLNITNVRLYGFSKESYLQEWQNAPEGITFIFDTIDNFETIMAKEKIKIDLVYTFSGIERLLETQRKDGLDIEHFRQLRGLLTPQGEIRMAFGVKSSKLTEAGFVYKEVLLRDYDVPYEIYKPKEEDLKGLQDPAKLAEGQEVLNPQTPGGIDLNPNQMDLQTTGEDSPLYFPVDPAMLESMINIDGAYPVILNVTPVLNLPLLLGIKEFPREESLSYAK